MSEEKQKLRARKYYKSVVRDHKKMLAKFRFVINFQLDEMIKNIELNNPEIRYKNAQKTPKNDAQDSQKQPTISFRNIINEQLNPNLKNLRKNCEIPAQNSEEKIGETNTDFNQIYRLGKLAMKIIPLEQQIARLDLNQTDLEELHLLDLNINEQISESENDMVILEEFFEKYSRANGCTCPRNMPSEAEERKSGEV